jgi:hypothetical protein
VDSDSEPKPKNALLTQLDLAALTDYQVQVGLTWSRTQYCLTLNAGLILVAAALLGLKGRNDSGLVVAVFLVGILAAAFSVVALGDRSKVLSPRYRKDS